MPVTRRCTVLLLLLAASCTQPAARSLDADAPRRATRNPYSISYAELQDPGIVSHTAVFAIQQLRPAFFLNRGPTSLRRKAGSDPTSFPGATQISQDFGPLQPSTALNTIDVRTLVEIRYLNVLEATARFGINANAGPVIVLLSTAQ